LTRRAAPLTAILLCLAVARLAPAGEPDVDKQVGAIVAKLRRAETDELWDAERRLVQLGDAAVGPIKTHLAKARPPARLALAKALCSLGHTADALEPLVELIQATRSPELGIYAASVLGSDPARDDPATETALLRLADNAKLPPDVTRAVARALYSTATDEEGLKKANATLRRLLVAAKDKAHRRDCAIDLAEIQDFQPPVEAILKKLAQEPTPQGRLARALLQNRDLHTLLLKPTNREGRLNDKLLQEIKTRIQMYHVEKPLPDHELINAAAKGMVARLQQGDHPDRHSAYLDEADWKKFNEHITRHYTGIGAVVQFVKHPDTGDEPVFTVIRPNYSGPAYKAGVRSYDRIIEVNGEPTAGKKSNEIVDALRGERDTEVEIAITRAGVPEPRKIKVTRAAIDIPSVQARMLPARIGYVRLSAFSNTTARDLDEALRDLEKQGMVALVLDLRSNPGGRLDAAVEIADKFLKDNKLIVYTEGRNPRVAPRREFRTKDPVTHPDFPMVVLVNGYSASASEIVSGALQDHQRATLIGQKTYGKGSVQNLFPVQATAGQSRLKLTVAKYYLPSGRSIHGKGVEPDIKVAPKPTYTREEFAQLRESGDFARYTATRFAQHKKLFAELARFDALDPGKYPDFEAWHKGLAKEFGRDKARRLLRAWLRILVADDRGAEYVCNLEEDNQLQRAILEIAKQFDDIDPMAIPDYRFFAAQPPQTASAADPDDKEAHE